MSAPDSPDCTADWSSPSACSYSMIAAAARVRAPASIESTAATTASRSAAIPSRPTPAESRASPMASSAARSASAYWESGSIGLPLPSLVPGEPSTYTCPPSLPGRLVPSLPLPIPSRIDRIASSAAPAFCHSWSKRVKSAATSAARRSKESTAMSAELPNECASSRAETCSARAARARSRCTVASDWSPSSTSRCASTTSTASCACSRYSTACAIFSLAIFTCSSTRDCTLLEPPALPDAFCSTAVPLLPRVCSAEPPAWTGEGPLPAERSFSPWLVDGICVAVVAGALACSAPAFAGCWMVEELPAEPESWTALLFSAYLSSMALMAFLRAPSTSTCFSAPLATANSVPRTASVVLGVTTLKSFERPTLSTLKSARPCLTAAEVRSVSPSCAMVGSWNSVPASRSAVALRPTRSAACERSPVRTSTPAATTSLIFASCQGAFSFARHCTLPDTSMNTARNGSPAGASAAGAASPGFAAGSCALAKDATADAKSAAARPIRRGATKVAAAMPTTRPLPFPEPFHAELWCVEVISLMSVRCIRRAFADYA